MNADFDIKQLQAAFVRHRATLAFLIIAALAGFTGWQVSQITAIQADPAYIEQVSSQTKTTSLKTNKATLEQLKTLRPAGDVSIPVNVGKQNPFNLN